MDKLRSTFKKYQSQVYADKPRYVSSQKVTKYKNLAEQETRKMENSNNFADIGEAIFYKEKFEELEKIAERFENKQITDSEYHHDVRQAMARDFHGNEYAGGSALRSNPRQSNIERQERGFRKTNHSKSPLKDFFQEQEIKNSKKVTFSNLVAPNDVPVNMGLRSTSRPKSGGKGNRSELRKLQEENRRLREKIESSMGGSQYGDDQIRDLHSQVRTLDEENRRLREEMSKASSNAGSLMDEEYDPYNLRVRENNITKINHKNLYMSERSSQFGHNDSFYKSRQSQDGRSDHERMSQVDMMNESRSSINTQFLNLEKSELYDTDKNQICREKIAFFKRSMVLVKQRDYEIAFKRSDFNSQMDKLRLILYINNKDHQAHECDFKYDYDRDDFELDVRRSISRVESRNQGREEIEVVLRNASDLGSLITAEARIGPHRKKITIPTLFIDFSQDYKYQFENIGYIERNISQPLTIRPMSQFDSIENASNVLDLDREFEEKYETAKLYGKSKTCKGIVKLTWKSGGKLKIETCEEWRTLMGYLFLNAEETMKH